VLVADKQQIDRRPGHLQVVNPQLTQRGRQLGLGEVDLGLGGVDLQAQARLDEEEHGSR
jgi:hypothetical protein